VAGEVERPKAADERVDVVVVGGGLAGLTAAWRLRDLDVVVLEADARVGGRIRSEPRGDVWLNFGAHVFGSPSSATGRLIDELDVRAQEVPGRLAAVAFGGRIAASGRVETYPFRLPLSHRSRAAFLRAGARLRLAVRRYASVAKERHGEDPAARQLRMLQFRDDRSFSEFIGPLPKDVDGIFRATLTRSSGEPEELAAGYGIGYFHLVWSKSGGLSRNIRGGSSTLPDALAAGLGGGVRTGALATSVVQGADEVLVTYREAVGRERSLRARSVVVATSAYVAREIVSDLPAETAAALEEVRYGPYVVGAFLTRERAPMPWDRIYALATPESSFGMLFNTANVLRTGTERTSGGSLMVYAAADAARALAELDDEQVARRFMADLGAIYPETDGIVEEVVIQRWERGLPYAAVGRSALQEPLTRPLGRVHLAGDYLGTWYTETAIQTAERAAAAARAQAGSSV
jgi:oxygen-dependent protoporphyrinogen oxidase